ncbi:protein DpdH [Rhodococcus erythropolis]
MSDFVNYLCWDPTTVPSSIATEAVSADREVFLATHSPLRINQARLLGGTDIENTGIAVREEDVLKDFLEAKSTTGALLMPIVGGSGSGKSHLVRWMNETIPEVEARKIIYLEKYKTSLRAVITALTQDSESGVLADLRRDIDLFSEGTSESKLANDLLDQLASTLLHTIASREDRNGRTLLGEKGLQILLHDPEIRGIMLTPGKFIPELARQLLQDKRDGDGDRPPWFSTSDLPIDIDGRVLEDATKQAKQLIRMLSSNPELQIAAVQLLNDHLESAVKKAANLSGGRLGDAMRVVREEYKMRGQEIILLIEDFALIQGVQGDLVDAILEPSTRDGVESMAPIRTMMAVTTGYFHKMDETVLTRIGATSAYIYNLDVTFDDKVGIDLSSVFVGKYLNVARLLSNDSTKHGVATGANACDKCDFKTKCHDSFGTSQLGHGLYPFNASAMTRMIHSTAGDDPERFTPRTVLSQVVIPTLNIHADGLRRGHFPGERFDQEFPLSPIDSALSSELTASIERNDTSDADRRKTVLTFWGNGETQQVNPDILRAFNIAPLELPLTNPQQGVTAHPSMTPPQPKKEQSSSPKQQSTPTTGLSLSLEKQITELENWTRGSPLTDAEISRLVRGFLARTVSDSYLWTTPITKPLNQGDIEKFWWNKAGRPVSIEDANEHARKGKDGLIHFTRSADNSLLFQEIHLANSEKRGISGRYNRRLAMIAEQHSGTFAREIENSRYSSNDVLVQGMIASLMGAALFGKVRPQTPITDVMSILFDDGALWTLQELPNRIPEWENAAKQHKDGRPTLIIRLREAFGISKGASGAVMYLDAVRILPLLERARKTWTWQPPANIPDWLAPASKSLSRFPAIMAAQAETLQSQIATVRQFAPRGVTWAEIVSGVREALDATTNAGLPTQNLNSELQRVISEQIDVGWAGVIAIEDDLIRIGDAPDNEIGAHNRRVIACTRPHSVDFDTIITFLTATDRWLDQMLQEQSLDSAANIVEAASKEVSDVVSRWVLSSIRQEMFCD